MQAVQLGSGLRCMLGAGAHSGDHHPPAQLQHHALL